MAGGSFFPEAVFEMDLETVVADSVVYEPSREQMPVSEGPGLDYNVDSGPEMPIPGFVDRLNMPGGNFAGVGPVEPSPALPHMSDPLVPSGVVVSGSNLPMPVFGLLLVLSDLSSAAEDLFPEPGSLSAWPGFTEMIRPRLREAPSRALWSRGVSCNHRERTLCTGYRILSQRSRNMLCGLKLVHAFWDGFGTALQEFVDICTVDLACPCLHEMFLIGPRTRPFSPSATGDAHPSYVLEILCLSVPQPFGPIRASRVMAGECFLKLDDIVFCLVPGVYIRVISSLCFYVIGWHWICVIQLGHSGTSSRD